MLLVRPHLADYTRLRKVMEFLAKKTVACPRGYFLCGDPSLELQAQVSNQIGSQTLPADTWKNVHKWLKNSIDSCVRKLGGSETVDIFVDYNPSFSSYTELVLVASDNVIILCSSNGSSARVLRNVRALVYENSALYNGINFFSKCQANGLQLSLIHTIVLNRTTQYSSKASTAFQAMFDEIKRVAVAFKRDLPTYYTGGEMRFVDIPDHHSVAIVSCHTGKPLFALTPGTYTIHDAIRR